jgi:hypothetical protein
MTFEYAVNIWSGHILITEEEDIEITLDYPLKNPFVVKAHHKNGFDLKDFVKAIKNGYIEAYNNPEKYEPWGHSIGELFLEDIIEESPGKFKLHVGS